MSIERISVNTLKGAVVASVSYTQQDGSNDECRIRFADGRILNIYGVWHNDSTGGLSMEIATPVMETDV
jgi:head-tail adaptor